MEFYQTVMGKQFYDATMPRIAKNLERIADALEKDSRDAQEGPSSKRQLGCWESSQEKSKMALIPQNELAEFVGQIIDTFEDFLEERGLDFMTDEKREALESGEMDEDSMCIIYGSDYGDLQTGIEDILRGWKLTEDSASDSTAPGR